MLKIKISYDNIDNKVKEPTVDSVGFLVTLNITKREESMTNNRTSSASKYTFAYNEINNDFNWPTYIDANDSTTKTNLFDLSSYVLDVVDIIRHMMKDLSCFDLNDEKIRRFSFGETKLQKIIIISVIEYLTKVFYANYSQNELNDEFSEKFIKKYNPVEDLEILINRKCGFLIEYNFLKFGLTSSYNRVLNGDVTKSVQSYLVDNYSFTKLKKEILAFESTLSDYDIITYSKINDYFKETILDVIIKFVLYPPYDLGAKLNCIKGSSINEITEDSDTVQKIPLNVVFLESIKTIGNFRDKNNTNSSFIEMLEKV